MIILTIMLEVLYLNNTLNYEVIINILHYEVIINILHRIGHFAWKKKMIAFPLHSFLVHKSDLYLYSLS